MILELVHEGRAAVMTGRAIHDALGPVGLVALGLMAFAAGLDGILLGEDALEILALFNLGIEDFHGLATDVGGQTAATLVAGLAGGFRLAGVAPFGNGDMAQHGTGSVLMQIALHALGGFAGVEDGQRRFFRTSGTVR